MTSDIVCERNMMRHYGDDVRMLRKYQEIMKSGKCPFCEENVKKPIIGSNDLWTVMANEFPYENAQFHFLITPRRHVTSLSCLTPKEWAMMWDVLKDMSFSYPISEGGGLAIRSGEIGGATLHHLHFHFIVPKTDENGPIAVNFGIG